MLTKPSVLCPVDFSEQSRDALRWASAITLHRGGELTVLSVIDSLLAQAARIRLGLDLAHTQGLPELREFVEATLREQTRQESHLRMEVMVGAASEGILQTSRRRKPSLIVMGTHGLGGFRKLVLGSTTEQVLQRTEWPVLAVPAGAVSAPAVTQPGVQVKRILLATDFRESAMAAAQWAGDLAGDISVPLVLAHIVEPVLVPPQWQAVIADFEADRVASAQRALTKLSANFHNSRNECVVSIGHPADRIASLAVEREAGLVVLGLANPEDSKPRKPGTIAYQVLRIAHVAVVVVPAPQQPLSTAPATVYGGQSVAHPAETS